MFSWIGKPVTLFWIKCSLKSISHDVILLCIDILGLLDFKKQAETRRPVLLGIKSM